MIVSGSQSIHVNLSVRETGVDNNISGNLSVESILFSYIHTIKLENRLKFRKTFSQMPLSTA